MDPELNYLNFREVSGFESLSRFLKSFKPHIFQAARHDYTFKKSMCPSYLKGRCIYDKNCRFAHGINELR